MDPTRDNPIFRFKAAWWALAMLLLFAVLALILRIGFPPPAPDLEELAAANRYRIRAEVDAAQKANLEWKEIEPGKTLQAPPEAVFPIVAKELLSTNPTPAATPKPAGSEQSAPDAPGKPAGATGPVDGKDSPAIPKPAETSEPKLANPENEPEPPK